MKNYTTREKDQMNFSTDYKREVGHVLTKKGECPRNGRRYISDNMSFEYFKSKIGETYENSEERI